MALNMAHRQSPQMASLGIYSLPHSRFLQFRVSGGSLISVTTDLFVVYDRLGIAWATSILGFISVALLPIPWILFIWGPKIRQKSAYTIIER
jgi:hypothetical protein